MVKVTDSDAKALAALVFAVQTWREEVSADPGSPSSIIDYALSGTSRESLMPGTEGDAASDLRLAAYTTARNSVRGMQWNAEHFKKETLSDLLIALGSGLQERAKESPTLIDQLADLFSRSYHQQNRLAGVTLSKLRAFFLRPDESAQLERIFAEELKCASCGVDLKPNEALAYRRAGRGAVSSLSCSRCELPLYVRCSEPECQDFHILTSKMRMSLGSRKCDAHRRGAVEAPRPAPEVPTPTIAGPELEAGYQRGVWTIAEDPVPAAPARGLVNTTGASPLDGRAMAARWVERGVAAAPRNRGILPSDSLSDAFTRMYQSAPPIPPPHEND